MDRHVSSVRTDRQILSLIALGTALRSADYHFITPTPATHAIVNARPDSQRATCLPDVFGWSRPFRRSDLPADMLMHLTQAGAVEQMPDAGPSGGLVKSRVRFASLGDLLLVHSAFPTVSTDAVFFGPDTYRFARLLREAVIPTGRIVDVGCGTGAGGLSIGRGDGIELLLTDINDRALAFSKVNAILNGKPDAKIGYSDILADVDGPLDLIIANPPYMCDGPTYRDGGALGIEIARSIVVQSLPKLAPGGRLLLYTGTPVIAGIDAFHNALMRLPIHDGYDLAYDEIDPDLFGDELTKAPYAHVDRIAAVALSLTKRT